MSRLVALAAVAALALSADRASAALVVLDFTSGGYADELGSSFPPDTYNQDGFKLQVATPGNHIDVGYLGALGFHNGPANDTQDNDLILTFSGGAFDFVGVDISGFDLGAVSLDLVASNGATASYTTTGFKPTPAFTNVTFVRFSITPDAGSEGVGFNSMTVNNVPTVAAVPEPASLLAAAVGLPCLGAVVRRARRRAA